MNIVDILIIILVIGALLRGQELGFVRQLFSTVGFFGGLIIGALLEPHVVGYAHTSLSRALITLASTLGTAMILLGVGEVIGALIKESLQFKNGLNYADNSIGAALAAVSLLALVWMSSAILVTLPYPSLQSSIRDSEIVGTLDRHLPGAPNLFAVIGHLIAPNGFPAVFIGAEPSPSQANLPTPAALTAAVIKDQSSVVKIVGQGCGGIVEGSGFVADNGLIATNAHVIAGISNPYVVDSRGDHQAEPIWFDPNLDFAVLRVANLPETPLTFDTNQINHGTQGGVLGYPGGGHFAADSAAVLDEFTAVGRNIYDQGNTQRDVYSVSANIVPGNSGGPLVDLDGNVIGVVFAASTSYNNVGYALSIHQVINELNQAKQLSQPVSTGNCAE